MATLDTQFDQSFTAENNVSSSLSLITLATPPPLKNSNADLHGSTTTPARPCFLGLPPELRLIIYELALDHNIGQIIESLGFSVRKICSCKPRTSSKPVENLQLSLAGLALTCRLVASEVRDMRSRLRPEERFASIVMRSTIEPHSWTRFHAYLGRASCCIADLTALKLTLDLDVSKVHTSFWSATLSKLRLCGTLKLMFDRSELFGFVSNATKLSNIEIYIRVKDKRVPKYDAEFARLVRDRGPLIATSIEKTRFGTRSSMGVEGFRNVRFVEYSVNND